MADTEELGRRMAIAGSELARHVGHPAVYVHDGDGEEATAVRCEQCRVTIEMPWAPDA